MNIDQILPKMIQKLFAIQASDNSMAPLLDVGDIAIIKKYKEFLNKKLIF